MLEAFNATDTETDGNLTAPEMVQVSKAVKRTISMSTANKWIALAQVFNEQKHISFEAFITMMEKKLEKDQKYSLRSFAKKFNALERLGYTKDKVSVLDKSCRCWLPALFFFITILMFVVELSNINYQWKPQSSGSPIVKSNGTISF